MKVSVTQHGGFAAGIRRPTQIVDTTLLTASKAKELKKLIENAVRTPLANDSGHARDTITYAIQVEKRGSEPIVFSQSDASMSEDFASLLDWFSRTTELKE
jgi:hypothetical protein